MSRMSEIDSELRYKWWKPTPWSSYYEHITGRYRIYQLPSGKVVLFTVKVRWLLKTSYRNHEIFDSLAEAVYYVSQKESAR